MALEQKWVNKARKHQLMHWLVYNEGKTVAAIARGWGGSVAYTHTLLSELYAEGKVVKCFENSSRYGKVVIYMTKFHYVAEGGVCLNVEGSTTGHEVMEMVEAFQNRACTSAEWYGFAPIDLEPPAQQGSLL